MNIDKAKIEIEALKRIIEENFNPEVDITQDMINHAANALESLDTESAATNMKNEEQE